MSRYMRLIGQNARKASLDKVNSKTKNKVLKKYAFLLGKEKKSIFKANQKDIQFALNKGLKSNLIERLTIDEKKLIGIKNSIDKIANLKDPVDTTLEKWRRPNGLTISRVSIPIGVIGVIYESRPNVTSDVASLCFKSGNAVILKGGSEAINTNKILAKLFRKSLKENKVNENFIQFIDSKDRKMVDFMLSKMKDYIDVIIPRGGKNLVKRVQQFSNVPIIGHLEGLCHTFIDKDANLKMATNVTYNAKLRNTSICGATETILMHEKIVKKFCNPILKKLEKTNEIVVKSTSQFTIVTICKYECYQDENEDTNKPITNNQQTTNKQSTTNKNEKKEKNEKEVILDSWIEYRKSAKKTLTQQSIKSILVKMENYTNEQCKFVINKSIEQGWQGLFWDNIQTIQEVNEPKKWKAPWS